MKYNDYELLYYVAEEGEEAKNILIKKYEPLITSTAKNMLKYANNTGLELGDLIQEGMVGLSKAVEYFKESKETTFYTYAKICIERKILDAITTARRKKHRFLNESISYEVTDDDGNEIYLDYILKDDSENPEKMLLNSELEQELILKIEENLSDIEKEVFELKINNFTRDEISEITGKDKKAIDNALLRIKKKTEKIINDKGFI